MADPMSDPSWDKFYEPDPTGFDREGRVLFKAGAWDAEIQDLELFFLITLASPSSIKIGGVVVVSNHHVFVQSHMETVKAQNGNPTYRPYLDRLITLKKLMSDDTGNK